jgi:hypothetical protein
MLEKKTTLEEEEEEKKNTYLHIKKFVSINPKP